MGQEQKKGGCCIYIHITDLKQKNNDVVHSHPVRILVIVGLLKVIHVLCKCTKRGITRTFPLEVAFSGSITTTPQDGHQMENSNHGVMVTLVWVWIWILCF